MRVLVGYFNRNTKQELDIPIGPNNRIEPGGPDQGQPTHFQTGRQWGVFSFKAPANFASQTLTWTLVVNGQTNTITMHMRPEWIVEPFEDVASKNTPPVIKFQPDGPAFTGPPSGVAAMYAAFLLYTMFGIDPLVAMVPIAVAFFGIGFGLQLFELPFL